MLATGPLCQSLSTAFGLGRETRSTVFASRDCARSSSTLFKYNYNNNYQTIAADASNDLSTSSQQQPQDASILSSQTNLRKCLPQREQKAKSKMHMDNNEISDLLDHAAERVHELKHHLVANAEPALSPLAKQNVMELASVAYVMKL